VNRHEDKTLGMRRIEITCAACGGHLGHVFKGEGFSVPSMSIPKPAILVFETNGPHSFLADERHCVNSVSLKFHDEK
jgi:peptide-methionine (R)-S-oxide reductase